MPKQLEVDISEKKQDLELERNGSKVNKIIKKFNIDSLKKIFNIRSIYFALFMFLWLRMCLNPFIGALIGAGAYFVKQRHLRLPIFFLAFIFTYIHYLDVAKSLVCILPGIAGIIINEIAVSFLDDDRLKNHLKLLLFSMIAMIVVDFSVGGIYIGIYHTYISLVASSSMHRVFNIFILAALINIINLAVNKVKVSAFIIYNLFFVLGAINYWVTEITGKSLIADDIYNVTAAAGVLSGVQVEIRQILVFIIYVLLIVAFNFALYKCKFNKIRFVKRILTGAKGLVAIIIMVYFLLGNLFIPLMFEPVLKYGLASHLIMSAKGVEKPTYYEEFLNENKLQEVTVTEKADGPNIIVVMSEAFSDLSVVGDIKTNVDYMPNIRKVMNEYPSGMLYSSVIGNNTCSTEYEFLAGVPTGLTARGSLIFQKEIEENETSIISLVEQQGYKTVGVHPYKRSGYNRENAWLNFGFDEVYFDDDFENPTTIRNLIDDKSFYNKIIEIYENKGNNPLFLFGISMQNHATYLTDYKDEVFLDGMNHEDVNEYLSLLKVTDEETAELINYFENQNEDTMIVFFGDHQPMIGEEFYINLLGNTLYASELSKSQLAYKVPYFIWTNYDTEYNVPEEMSVNYLPNIVLEAAGLEKDAWFNFTDMIFEKFPVITERFIKINDNYIGQEDIKKLLTEVTIDSKENPLYMLKQMQVQSHKKAFD